MDYIIQFTITFERLCFALSENVYFFIIVFGFENMVISAVKENVLFSLRRTLSVSRQKYNISLKNRNFLLNFLLSESAILLLIYVLASVLTIDGNPAIVLDWWGLSTIGL